MHHSVMVKEALFWLRPKADGLYLDGTVGEGGHSEEILRHSDLGGRVIGLDRDETALASARDKLSSFAGRVQLMHTRYEDFFHVQPQVKTFDGIILDLGVSSRQLDTPARGFSFASDGPLDMRMDVTASGTAADLINRLPEAELARIIYEYGEERYSRRIARAILRRRESGPILTTQALVDVIRGSVPPVYLHGRLHCATRTFQALRIAVNHELEGLGTTLIDMANVLSPGGRFVVLSFHSLEDRIVKHTFRGLVQSEAARFKVLTKRPVTPSSEECLSNPRARSAKLRVLERKEAIS